MTSSTVQAWHIDGHRPRVVAPWTDPGRSPWVRGSPDDRPQRSPTPGSPATTASRGAGRCAAALAAYAAGTGSQVDALAAVRASRLLVPVVAVLGEVEVDERGLDARQDQRHGDRAAAGRRRPDGAARLHRHPTPCVAWDPEARPVPVTARTAAQAALQDGAAAIVVDVAGPATFVVEGEDLEGLARGWTLAPGRRPLRLGRRGDGLGNRHASARALLPLPATDPVLPIPG